LTLLKGYMLRAMDPNKFYVQEIKKSVKDFGKNSL